jgi:hypothetical protein
METLHDCRTCRKNAGTDLLEPGWEGHCPYYEPKEKEQKEDN